MDFMNFIMEKSLILIPALYIVGCILKKANFIKDKYIPYNDYDEIKKWTS